MMAEMTHSEVSGKDPSSLLVRRQRPNQPSVLSTTQRRGRTWKPYGPSGGTSGGSAPGATQHQRRARRTTATVQPTVCSTHSVNRP
jgi:hypothetical protein